MQNSDGAKMAKSNKRKTAIQKDLKRLITLVTGFEEKDENFPICMQYVDSNIKYHRYLSPDSHKIHRALDGLSEKFEIHSQSQKATDLKELTASFLDQPGLDGKDTGKTDVHYAMLSLLVNLAVTPTLVDFERKQPEPVAEELDNFDWRGYLLDGEDLNFLSHASSDSDEEESLDGSADGGDDDKDRELKTTDGVKNDSKLKKELQERDNADASEMVSSVSATSQSDLSHSVAVQNVGDEYAQLERSLVTQYWKGKGTEETVGGSHEACNMSRNWKRYQQRLNPIQSFTNQMVVTEAQIVRETLWMLSGVTDLFVFKHDHKGFHMDPDVYVVHLTPEALENSLTPLMLQAQKVHVMDTFIADTVSQRCNWVSSESLKQETGAAATESIVPQTYLAFAACMSEFLTDYRAELVRLEKLVMKQEKTILLTSLTTELRPWLQKVEAVHRVVMHGISPAATSRIPRDDNSTTAQTTAAASEEEEEDVFSDTGNDCNNNCSRATLLLDTLYDSVFEYDLTAQSDQAQMTSLMLTLLVKCSQPLLQIISDWINVGMLTDIAAEFVLHRNKDIKSLDETFWEKAFAPSMHTSTAIKSSTFRSDGKSSTSRNSSSRHTSSSSSQAMDRGESVGQDPHSAEYIIAAGPKLLQPILKEAILTGKSMEMLENLGRMREALNVNSNIFQRPPSLYELFVGDLWKALMFEKPTDVSAEADAPCDGSAEKTQQLNPPQSATSLDYRSAKIAGMNKDATIERQLNLPGLKDTLMNINFAALFNYPESATGGRRDEPRCPSSVDCDLKPLMSLCGSCLYPHVRVRYRTVCSKLVQILKEEYNLMDCIHAMQRYYLMSAGEVMYNFYTPVFNKIESREPWRDSSLLEMFLHEAVELSFPADVERLSVEISAVSKSNQKSAINATDCIHLKYNVPWPVDVVISRKCQDLYNNVFTFILQIKRAKYTLDQLRFDDLSREQAVPLAANEFFPGELETTPRRSRIHQFHLLRFRLLYFVNSMHNYIMTRILHSTELEFGCQLDAALDLDQIIHIHSQYVEAIHERCLLHPRLTVLREAVVRVLNLSFLLGTRWRQGVDFSSGEAIREIDTELTRCVDFLSSFLQNVIKRGSYPHLESLAFALASSLQFKLASGIKIV